MRPSIMFYLCRIKKPLKKKRKRKKAIPKVQRIEVTVRWRGIERADLRAMTPNILIYFMTTKFKNWKENQ
jgi:hypothetical protein